MPDTHFAGDTPSAPAHGFIGRRRELAEVEKLLGGARLLTMTGSAGCGKTRLARQLADQLNEQISDQAVRIDLAPLADSALAAAGPGARLLGDTQLRYLSRDLLELPEGGLFLTWEVHVLGGYYLVIEALPGTDLSQPYPVTIGVTQGVKVEPVFLPLVQRSP
jgi:hypothetical protein